MFLRLLLLFVLSVLHLVQIIVANVAPTDSARCTPGEAAVDEAFSIEFFQRSLALQVPGEAWGSGSSLVPEQTEEIEPVLGMRTTLMQQTWFHLFALLIVFGAAALVTTWNTILLDMRSLRPTAQRALASNRGISGSGRSRSSIARMRAQEPQFGPPFPKALTPGGVVALFAEQAQTRADSVALIHCEGNVVFTYQALAAAACALADGLINAGLSKGDIVALLLQPSPCFVVATLGTMQAHIAWLPLDMRSSEVQFSSFLVMRVHGLPLQQKAITCHQFSLKHQSGC